MPLSLSLIVFSQSFLFFQSLSLEAHIPVGYIRVVMSDYVATAPDKAAVSLR